VAFLNPDASDVAELDAVLRRANMGVVSHYYMDPELQGVLAACPTWPHVVTSDSLAMGDMAVKMVREGNVDAIACLGVDFMAESVRAMLDTSGYASVPVYRLAEKAIGCSLAEAAEGAEYRAWLEKARNTPNRWISHPRKCKAFITMESVVVAFLASVEAVFLQICVLGVSLHFLCVLFTENLSLLPFPPTPFLPRSLLLPCVPFFLWSTACTWCTSTLRS